jgi:hypothetical protein
MRFLAILKATANSEAGVVPSEKLLADMAKFHEELVNAGVLLEAEGLHPSATGVRLRFAGGTVTVTDGPFAESKELVAGIWILQVRSKDEAVEWMTRCPPPMGDAPGEIELRQVYDPADFPPDDAIAHNALPRDRGEPE